jgi:hypothetical protein
MPLAALNLDGTTGDLILGLYAIGGLLLAGTALLPGSSTLARVLKAVIGLGLAGWSAYVFLFGGYILLNYYVAALPFILAFQGVRAMMKRRENAAGTSDAAPAAPAAEPTR